MTAIIPCLHYRDGPAAVDWLCRAFGFEAHSVHETPDGKIAHAELRLGGSFIMLGSIENPAFDWKIPGEVGFVTQSIYISVDDPDAHHDRAEDAGAEIVRALADTDYGSREYSARDPEGHLWHFGTYRPA